jgi:hypothetical protein
VNKPILIKEYSYTGLKQFFDIRKRTPSWESGESDFSGIIILTSIPPKAAVFSAVVIAGGGIRYGVTI